MKPPLAYPGGKTQLVKEILKRMPPHTTFIEPFVGGGSLFFAKPKSKKEVLNDKMRRLKQPILWLRRNGACTKSFSSRIMILRG